MSSDDSILQNAPITTLYVSTITISLAKGSDKTIESVELKKNNNLLRNSPDPERVDGVHRFEFSPPFVLNPDDHVSVSVNCRWPSVMRERRADVLVVISPRDIECMRDERGVRSYRKKGRKIEVVLTGQQSDTRHAPSPSPSEELIATTTSIIESCSQFRLLIIGNSGVGKSTLIHRVFGVENVHTSENVRGLAKIDDEFASPTNNRFVVHDSLGFEAGDERNLKTVKDFVDRRQAMPDLKNQLHAIWLCLEIPYSGGRLLEAGVEEFLRRREEILGKIPLVVVLTKVDLLDTQLELDLPENETLENYKSTYLNEHCIGPLREAAGSDITHVAVSVEEGYSELLSNLVEATDENMAKYHIVEEAPRIVASIAQRVSIKEKIELSIAVGKKKYWKHLLKSAFFRGHTLKECLQVIRQDVVTIWNFNDPDECLLDDNIMGALLRTDNVDNAPGAPPSTATFSAFLTSALELLKALTTAGDVTLSVVAPVAGLTVFVIQNVYEAYQEAKKDVKVLIAYIVDLICVMQVVFILTSSGFDSVTRERVAIALQAYEKPRKVVHLLTEAFDGKQGVLPGGRDLVLEKIEELIWRYSIADHEIEELKRRGSEVLSPVTSREPE